MKKIFYSVILISVFLLLILGFKGESLNTDLSKKLGSVFESSNTTSRYALVEAIVDNHTFSFTETQADFASPDLVKNNGKYFSIFTPGVSFLAVPLYLLGKIFSLEQSFTLFLNVILALLNFNLIVILSKKIGASIYAAILGGLIFLFATNALAYTFTLTQHHASVSILLLGLINTLSKRTLKNNLMFGALFGAAVLMDIPNLFLMFPVATYVVLKHIKINDFIRKVQLSVKFNLVAVVIGLLPFIALFAFYNYSLTGSASKIGQNIGRTDYGAQQRQETPQKSDTPSPYQSHGALQTRAQLNGLYILLISNERGWIYYSPIILFGFFGLFALSKKDNDYIVPLFSGVILINILIYSLFTDPWGGWSFGPRYLIPATALMCVLTSVAIQSYGKRKYFIAAFIILLAYSSFVNILGASTTNAIPPKVEAVALQKFIPYTYEYNFQLASEDNMNSSLLFNSLLKQKLSSLNFISIFFTLVMLMFAITYINFGKEKKNG